MLEQAGFTVSETSLYGGSRQTAEERDEMFTLYCSVVAVLVLVAGLMSGLTLGLMSLDTLDLEVCSYEPSISPDPTGQPLTPYIICNSHHYSLT